MFINPITETEILTIISNLKNTKAYDSFELPVHIIKKIAPNITEPLIHLINQSFSTGIVPKAMKTAKITPIYKCGDSHNMTNYRPISKLSCFSKILERAMHVRLYDFLESNDILYNKQFGFRKNHSTSYAIIEIVDRITEALDRRKITIGVFLDLSKAFDTIKHDILLDKLAHYGVRGLALNWFRSYLADRFQQVNYNNSLSNLVSILCGVPQGSILGPLLFLVYINDITNCTSKLLFFLFADDTNVFITGDGDQELFTSMNTELSHLTNWFHANILSLNAKKTNYIIFSGPKMRVTEDPNKTIIINNTPIIRVQQTKFLGMILDEHLTWRPHINLVKNKASKMIGIIRRLRYVLPSHTLRSLYNAFILPYFNYGTIIWAGGYKTPLTPIHLLQKRIVRIIAGAHYLAGTFDLFKSLNLLSIFDLHKLQLAMFMYRHQNHSLPSIFNGYFTTNASVHNYNTRTRLNLRHVMGRTNIRHNTVKVAGPRLWNAIDPSIRGLGSLRSFKLAFTRHLHNLA